MDSYAKKQNGLSHGTKHRMDIEFINTNEGPASSYIVDFVITGVAGADQTLRRAAARAEKKKVDHYTSNYVINEPDKRLVPWAVEAPGGAWGPRAIKFARYLGDQQCIHGGPYTPAAFYRMI